MAKHIAWFMCLVCIIRVGFASYPAADSGYVTDLASVLSPQEEERIEQWLWQVEENQGVEIAVVTIDSIAAYPGTNNGSIESFARGLFDDYGIGNMPANDGVLLLVAVKDRKVRIELGAGYGSSMDAKADRIIQGTILPRFRANDYAGGITDGVRELMATFANVQVATGLRSPYVQVGLLLLAIPVVALIAYSLFKSGKRGWGWICVGILIVLVLSLLRAGIMILQNNGRSSSSGWSSGGSGGGFGGGFSGGGGATGGW